MATSQILKFYEDANVFITGGTGFLGKILIEKLLRSTSVSTLYLLVRAKKGKDTEARIKGLFDDAVFDRLHKECPKFIHRIVGISGDVSLPQLGISKTDWAKLTEKIDIIFHVAATMRFDENLKLAYCVNVNGAKEILDLGRQMKNLKSIMHVSTAFSNCHLQDIEEKVYDNSVDYKEIGKVLGKLTETEAHTFTEKIIGVWPNTYTFTKALAESAIEDLGDQLPIGIFRPSIVISTYKEPIEGWIDNLYGPTGVCAGVSSGILRVMYCTESKNADLVPVDMCVASLIAAAWDTSQKRIDRKASGNIPIYNYVAGDKALTWEEFCTLNQMYGRRYPLNRTIWRQIFHMTNHPYIYFFLTLVLHLIPALLFDCVSMLFFKNLGLLSVYKKIHKFIGVLAFFSTREWNFSNNNVVKLWGKLDEQEKKIFFFDMASLDWWRYYKTYLIGLRKFILKESLDSIPLARKKQAVFDILHQVLLAVIYFTLSVFLWTTCQRFFSSSPCITNPS